MTINISDWEAWVVNKLLYNEIKRQEKNLMKAKGVELEVARNELAELQSLYATVKAAIKEQGFNPADGI